MGIRDLARLPLLSRHLLARQTDSSTASETKYVLIGTNRQHLAGSHKSWFAMSLLLSRGWTTKEEWWLGPEFVYSIDLVQGMV